jgi:hypothetical protein
MYTNKLHAYHENNYIIAEFICSKLGCRKKRSKNFNLLWDYQYILISSLGLPTYENPLTNFRAAYIFEKTDKYQPPQKPTPPPKSENIINKIFRFLFK